MSNSNDNNQKHYEYDGIVEHNHPLPAWWTWTFILTVCFAFIYYIHYEVTGQGLTLKQELEQSMSQLEKNKSQAASQVKTLSEDEVLNSVKDPKTVAAGAAVYTAKCAMCHGDKLEGKIGPNLTDNQWIHGGQPGQIVKTIQEGVQAKGMPKWSGVLQDEEIYQVAAFIISKKQ